MKEDVARRRHGVMASPDFTKRVQVFRLGSAKESVPRFRTKRHDTGQPPLKVTEADRAQQRGQITTQASHRDVMLRSGFHRHDEKNRGARERGDDGLRYV